MTRSNDVIQAHLDREIARRNTACPSEDGATAQQKLVRAAETGQLEAIVATAQTEPPKMVTPEEREAELRRTGQWEDKPKPKAKRTKAQAPEPKKPEPPLTPNEEYIAEHCHWRRRGPADHRPPIPYGRCMTEYDVFTGEIIGDGYIHDEEDDEW